MRRITGTCAAIAIIGTAAGCTNDPADTSALPSPTVVERQQVPQASPDTLFVLTLQPPVRSAAPALEDLLAHGVDVAEAWESGESQCMRIFDTPQLLVRLRSPDYRMRSFGFVPNGTIDGCFFTWRYYRF